MNEAEMREALQSGMVVCQWFATCENTATTTRTHGVFGPMPICERCNEKMSDRAQTEED